MIRFLHSADLHLGKPYGSMPEEVRGRLREARHSVLDRLAARAREGGAPVILLAGDVFDTETPSPAVLRQALAVMAHHGDLRWILLPGNHDSLVAEELWAGAARAAPANVTLALTPSPLAFAPGAMLLPAPCTTRRPGRDLTAWMNQASTAEGVVRIGLAHGPVQTFSEDGTADDVIAADRAAQAGLDYLALGDWHGQISIGGRTWYSGTPEPDRFKHDAPGRALRVTVAGAGAPPLVEPVETGLFTWRTAPLQCLPEDDVAMSLAGLLPEGPGRRQTLLRIAATGHARPEARALLEQSIAAAAPEFAALELDTQRLAITCESEDLDLIDRSGALRQAADGLLAESRDPDRPPADRDVAREALMRLFSYCAALPS
ncbi:DNA repair exonuclease [Aquabacter sp. L1I39]|uniref:metallophosphoesterase family protein n=1 Tax=Aquabacter sp. L1I39 TaxID=2820278 RepID=UPI001AD9ECFF|nr:DNA repair exonuclease [Aquabacter sp. L1I39]QTL02238.1 DNA repair exonuclease [Aquabacter sp. L1I39]